MTSIRTQQPTNWLHHSTELTGSLGGNVHVEPNTIVIWSDVGCPWASLAVHRLHAARSRLGLDDTVAFDHRAFPLELHNERPTSWNGLAAEVPVVGALAPDMGWSGWHGPPWRWPVTMLLALEAVQAAKEQGLHASDRLDVALRRAFFADSECLSLRHVVLEVAAATDGVEVGPLKEALDSGRARPLVMEQFAASTQDSVRGSPHLFFADGSDVYNPGVEQHWDDELDAPVVDSDDPSVFDDLLRRATEAAGE